MTTAFEEFVALPKVRCLSERDAIYENEFAGPHLLRAYYRFLDDGRVLITHHSENWSGSDSFECARRIFDLVEKEIDAVWGKMVMLPELSCDLPHLDHVLTVPPIVELVSFFKEDRRVARQRLYCAPVNKCEFTQNETKPEYLGRAKIGFPMNEWNREPVPGVSTAFSVNGGPKSRQRRPAVMRYTDVQKYVALTGEKGGVVTVENFERERCVFESDTPNADLSVVFRRETHAMRAEEALAFLDVLARQGGDAAADTL